MGRLIAIMSDKNGSPKKPANFCEVADEYSQFRPNYPDALIGEIANLVHGKNLIAV